MNITKNLILKFEEITGEKVIGKVKKTAIEIDGFFGTSLVEVKILSTKKGEYFITDNPEFVLLSMFNKLDVDILIEREEQSNICYVKKNDDYLEERYIIEIFN
ncbi:hypothetical protein [Brassicibacter mesophilus]|uniref:hypothetical protein n=1 Tax=Brassicibacter mesophilus TaxID=745119 RepID=UPI003D22AEE1